MNRRGEGGFMEAIAAVMVVTVSLTAFMGLLVNVAVNDSGPGTDDIGTDYISSLTVVDGKIVGDIHDDIAFISEKHGIDFIEVKVRLIGDVVSDSFYDCFGKGRTDNVSSRYGTLTMKADGGRVLDASYEVIYWT